MAMSGSIPPVAETADRILYYTLSEEELVLLNDLYLKILPLYQHLTDEYEKALKRATIARKKSEFPPKRLWSPPFPIGELERELLAGPQPQVTHHKKLLLDERTKKKIMFSSSEHELEGSRHKSSYVQIRQLETLPIPVLGRIKRLVEHTFAGTTYQMAIIHKFQDPHQDDDSGLWWVNPSKTNVVITPVSDLSPPRVTARCTQDKLWFLNVVL